MCSTAIVLQQLGDQDELNRTHGRLSFAVLLFQDLAFVPLLTLASVQTQAAIRFSPMLALRLVGLGMIGAGGGAGDRALGDAAAAVRDRPQPPARAVHARGAAGGADVGLDHRSGSGCRWHWAPSWPA